MSDVACKQSIGRKVDHIFFNDGIIQIILTLSCLWFF